MSDEKRQPMLDGDQIVTSNKPRPQDTVGAEGGSSLVGAPRRVDTDADKPDADREKREEDSTKGA